MFAGYYHWQSLQSAYRVITPFVPDKVSSNDTGQRVLSFGCGHCGYDLTLGQVFVFGRGQELLPPGVGNNHTNYWLVHRVDVASYNYVLDPVGGLYDVCVGDWVCVDTSGSPFVLGPGATVLVNPVENIRVLPDHVGICVGKSSYARCGVLVNTTPLEPGWFGSLVVEVTNLSPSPVLLRVGEGLCQLLLGRCERPNEYTGRWEGQNPLRDHFVGRVVVLGGDSAPRDKPIAPPNQVKKTRAPVTPVSPK